MSNLPGMLPSLAHCETGSSRVGMCENGWMFPSFISISGLDPYSGTVLELVLLAPLA